MFLGLDLGTTNVKAVVLDETGVIIAQDSTPVELYYGPGGAVEQDFSDIKSAAIKSITNAVSHVEAANILSIGISSQGAAIQILDSQREPAGRVISWMDTRGEACDDQLTSKLGQDWFEEHVGRRSSGMTIGQMLRLREQDSLPDNFNVAYVGDLIVEYLCSNPAHDASRLSLAMLYNPGLDRADPELMDILELNESHLPDLICSRGCAGTLLDDVATQLGLTKGIPVTPAIHDQYAAALGVGALEAGDVMIGTGTAWVLLPISRQLPEPVTEKSYVCRHVVPDRFGQILSMRNGGSSITWAMKIMGIDNANQIDGIIQDIPPGAQGVIYWPYLVAAGAGLDDDTTGRLSGLKLAHSQGDILRAVVEGLAYELNRMLHFLTDAEEPVKRLILCGGGANSSITPQIIADVTGLRVECITEPDASAIGAGMLARNLVDKQIPLEQIAEKMKPTSRILMPGVNQNLYAKLYDQYVQSLTNQ